MKTVLFLAFTLGTTAFSATEPLLTPVRPSAEIETSCRTKAKEIAAETYKTCMTAETNTQIEQIKKDYEAKLQALRDQYETEIKKMNAQIAELAGTEIEITKSEKATGKPSKKPAIKKQVPVKTGTVKKITPVPKVVSKKASRKVAPTEISANEMTIRLKPAPVTPSVDESTMDLPEPIPLEEIPM